MKETKDLGVKPIPQLIAKFSIPAVVAMLINAIYNVVDRIFIGKLVGESALAGLTISFPMMMMIFAVANLIGIGGVALLSIRLGEKDYKGASHVFGNTISFGILFVVIILASIFFNLNGILHAFNAEGDVLIYAKAYMEIILLGFIFQMMGFILSNFVRTEGKPFLSMVAMIAAAGTNIILDYVFISLMGLGVEGAAYGTIIGQFVGLVIYLNYYFRGRSNIHIASADFIPDFKLLGKIMGIGMSTFAMTVGTSVSMMFINAYLQVYGGNEAVTSMGAINSLYTFFIMPIMGVTQGVQPIIGFNYGAKQMHRSYETLRQSIIIGMAFSTLVFVVFELFAPTFVMMFLNEGSATIGIATKGLRIFIAMLPLLSINLMGIAFFQSIDRGRVSLMLGMLRQFLCLIPLLLVLPKFMGLNGVWIATPIADGLAILITGSVLMVRYQKDKPELDRKAKLVMGEA